MIRLLPTALLTACLIAPVATTVLRADDHDHDRDHDRVYQDRDRHDEHHWDNREDRAYRIWVRNQHRKYREFNRLNENDQAAYWRWRHEHNDSLLHIDIR